jgi:hypothetical protein
MHELNATNRWAVLGFAFPQLRKFFEMKIFYEGGDATFSAESIAAFARKHRIPELLDTIERVETGELGPDALAQFRKEKN